MAINSSLIKDATHDAGSNELTVTFHKGGSYVYEGVPAEAHAAMIAADSVGGHFLKNIKGTYKHRKL